MVEWEQKLIDAIAGMRGIGLVLGTRALIQLAHNGRWSQERETTLRERQQDPPAGPTAPWNAWQRARPSYASSKQALSCVQVAVFVQDVAPRKAQRINKSARNSLSVNCAQVNGFLQSIGVLSGLCHDLVE